MYSKLVWTCVILLGIVKLSDSASFRCYYKNTCLKNYEEVPLSQAATMLTRKCFDKNLKTMILVFGFTQSMKSNCSKGILEQAILRGDFNVCALNWKYEAANSLLLHPVSYIADAIVFMRKVAKEFAKALIRMAKNCLNLKTTYLIGNSLGAQLCGETGKEVIKHGLILGYIFGVEPAGPLFDEGLDSLERGCARLVIGVHTNWGQFGTAATIADIDIIANCGQDSQPGCPSTSPVTMLTFSDDALCSHQRGCLLMIEAMKTPNSLQASKAASCKEWTSGGGDYTDIVKLRIDIDETIRGIYFMKTNAAKPFGKYEDGASP